MLPTSDKKHGGESSGEDAALKARLEACREGINKRKGAKLAVPALLEGLSDPEARVRWLVMEALVTIAPAEPALHASLKALLDKKDLRRGDAAAFLLEIGAHVDLALNVLVQIVKQRWLFPSPSPIYVITERNKATKAILEHAPCSEAAASELRCLLDEQDPVQRIEIALALARLSPGDEAAFQVILEGAQQVDELRRRTAVKGSDTWCGQTRGTWPPSWMGFEIVLELCAEKPWSPFTRQGGLPLRPFRR